jgi:hypothetical protein
MGCTTLQNRESNRRLTLDGVTGSLAEWASASGLKEDSIYKRLKLGWSLEKTLNTPVRGGRERPLRDE